MRTRSRAIATGIGLALGGGFLLAGPSSGCFSYVGSSALSATDFCFVFDCQDGILGGTVDPCAGLGAGDNSGELPLFTDCPDFIGGP